MKEFAVRNSICSCQDKMHHVFCSNSDIPLICQGDSLNTLTDFLLSETVLDYFDIKYCPFFIRTGALIPQMKPKVCQKNKVFVRMFCINGEPFLSRNKSDALLYFSLQTKLMAKGHQYMFLNAL